jgi:hypothetical protein
MVYSDAKEWFVIESHTTLPLTSFPWFEMWPWLLQTGDDGDESLKDIGCVTGFS